MSGRWFRGLALFVLLIALAATWAWASPRASAAGTETGMFLGIASKSGSIQITRPASWRELALPVAPTKSLDARFSLGLSAAPSGRGANALIVARRIIGIGEYRIRA